MEEETLQVIYQFTDKSIVLHEVVYITNPRFTLLDSRWVTVSTRLPTQRGRGWYSCIQTAIMGYSLREDSLSANWR